MKHWPPNETKSLLVPINFIFLKFSVFGESKIRILGENCTYKKDCQMMIRRPRKGNFLFVLAIANSCFILFILESESKNLNFPYSTTTTTTTHTGINYIGIYSLVFIIGYQI